MTDARIQVGDVCLDLAQGRPVHVVEDTQKSANEWSAHNGYNLMENYGNSRLGVKKGDRVYDVVYCSNLKSEPSKTYAMPESRLARVETESADDGRPVYGRVVVDVLRRLMAASIAYDGHGQAPPPRDIPVLAKDAGIDADAVDLASELVDVDMTIGDGDDDE